jgi:alkylation response protein AidB-like acyl-CoA dehydrogenase
MAAPLPPGVESIAVDYQIIADNAATTEHNARPAPESLAAARRLGVLSLTTPISYGGRGADPATLARELAAIARHCPSTAWVAGTSATTHLLGGGLLGDAALAELFSGGDALWCGSGTPGGTVTRGPDGPVVSGRWPVVSGCEDAAWAGLAVRDGDGVSIVFMPTSALTVERTWDVAGMRGTGSHTLVADAVAVPEHRIGPFSPPAPERQRFFILCVTAPVVGAARGALDVVTAMFASGKKPHLTPYRRMGESPAARQWHAEATRLVGRAERTMLAVATEPLPAEHPGLWLNAQVADAAQDCRDALELMLDVHGSSAFAGSNPLQRFWRDVAVGSRHRILSPYLAIEFYGQALTGA